ncbi:translocase of chloroplast [Striga asiatica]|uniref:Translocase of chloroplast n=1 Tax=Striga asiatica TaxID=4170 RepID=A0A5A7QY05_STRAF|nr:translocase of chloroplast [Striga asiatica]
MAHPIGLGDHAPLLKPTSRAAQPNSPIPPSPNPVEHDETREKLNSIRVKFMRLVLSLGQTPANPIVAQLLYRLGLIEHLYTGHKPNAFAEQLETSGESPFAFPCTILVLGKSGSGKSSTLNSILNGPVFEVGPAQRKSGPTWEPCTASSSARLDAGGEGTDDVALMRTITDVLGRDIWLDTIFVLTHASSAPPNGRTAGSSYGAFVEQRSSALRRMVRLVSGDINPFANPVALAENHPSCRKNRVGQLWISNLLLLCFVSIILREASELLGIFREKKPLDPRLGLFTNLPSLLSTFLQWRKEVMLPSEQFIDDDCSDSSGDELEEYEKLPPLKPLAKTELEKLSKSEKKAYYDEVDYREKLFMKMQIKEEKMRREIEPETETEPEIVPGPDLPASFDSDNPTYLYRLIHYSSSWAVGPVINTNGWDHNTSFDGMYMDWPIVIGDRIPVTFSSRVFTNKKKTDLQMEIAGTVKHGHGKSTTVCLDVLTGNKRKDCILQSRTLFVNRRFNKLFAGVLDRRMRDRDELTGRFSSSFGINFVDFRGDFAVGLSSHVQIPIGRKSDLIGRFRELFLAGAGRVKENG